MSEWKTLNEVSRAQSVHVPGPEYPGLHSSRFRAMGSDFELWVASQSQPAAAAALSLARQYIDAAEAVMSRFRPESELCRLNARSGQPVRVSSLLFEVISAALSAAALTGGLYDPTVLSSMLRAGYDRSFDLMQQPFPEALEGPGQLSPLPGRERARVRVEARLSPRRVKRRPGAFPLPAGERTTSPSLPGRELQGGVGTARNGARWRDIRLHRAESAISLPTGVGIDLGGIGKAWAADKAMALLARTGPCIVSAGGDIAIGLGPYPGEGWDIGVGDPLTPGAHIAKADLAQCGVATSGVDYRKWTRNGSAQHHIIDPRTGVPANTDLLSATVIAADAVTAERHALAVMVLGAHDGLRYLQDQGAPQALLVRNDGETINAGWPGTLLPRAVRQ